MPDKPKYLTEEWRQTNHTVYALHDPGGRGECNRWWATVCPTRLGAQQPECEQIARLMKAAPKLLAACQKALKELEEFDALACEEDPLTEPGTPTISELRDAIAEATGVATELRQ